MTDLFADTEWKPPASLAIGMIVKLDRDVDRQKPCHDNLAIIYPGKAQHAGELRCKICNTHRGWLPKAALDFLTTTARCFGAPTEPLVLRDSTIGDHIMGSKQYDNSGILFNCIDDKRKGTDRDYRGELTINGVEYWLSGWIKEGKKGKFLGLAVKPKEDAARPVKSESAAADLNDSIPF